MPEGPEIRYLIEYIKSEILNRKLTKIDSLSKTKVKLPKETIIKDIKSKGKLMWLETNDNFIFIYT